MRKNWTDQEDHKAHDAREVLRVAHIFDAPWLLSKKRPEHNCINRDFNKSIWESEINSDFVGMSAEHFVKWLRDAVAHGDGRNRRRHRRTATRTLVDR